jgi:hypothetical protein
VRGEGIARASDLGDEYCSAHLFDPPHDLPVDRVGLSKIAHYQTPPFTPTRSQSSPSARA